jgi:nitrate/TMAO reductase-like tetraheme cytochrome c subunit
LLPILATWGGGTEQMETSKQTRFCLSCHVMTDFGRSLYYDDPGYLPAAHYQNRRIPRDQACYACHSGYTYFGGVKSKWRGLRHVYVQYFGNVPRPNEIRLYSPFPNATCLHCHEGARTFEEKSAHHRDAELLNRVRSGTQSCMSSGCHDIIHEVAGRKIRKSYQDFRNFDSSRIARAVGYSLLGTSARIPDLLDYWSTTCRNWGVYFLVLAIDGAKLSRCRSTK